MKLKLTALALLSAGLLSSGLALAEGQTLSLGYAQGKLGLASGDADLKLNGVHLQYRYEPDSPLGWLFSASYLKGNSSWSNKMVNGSPVSGDMHLKYYSLLAGPAYRVNDYFSLYALGGFSYVKGSSSAKLGLTTQTWADQSTKIAYGLGAIVNPSKNLSLTLGYEVSRPILSFAGHPIKNWSDKPIGGLRLAVGYRF